MKWNVSNLFLQYMHCTWLYTQRGFVPDFNFLIYLEGNVSRLWLVNFTAVNPKQVLHLLQQKHQSELTRRKTRAQIFLTEQINMAGEIWERLRSNFAGF